MTAEELLIAPNLGRCELVRNEVVHLPYSSVTRGICASKVVCLLGSFVSKHSLGVTLGASTGFHIFHNPDTVRAPDVAFVTNDRIPFPFPVGFFPGPPDIAVEVLSPGDRVSEVNDKTRDWLAAGCQEVWNVDPQMQTITVHRADGTIRLLTSADVLESPNLLKEFRLELKSLF